MKAIIGLGVAVTSLASAVWAQGPELGDYERSNAINCVQAYRQSAEQQEACFRRTSLLRDGRTPDQIRKFVADIQAQRQREQQQRMATIAAQQERERKQREEAQTRERNECLERSVVPASEVALVRAEKIQLGMSEAALLCSWGRPQSVNRSVGVWGEHKQYIYGRVYVYVENGKVTSWQD
jgi:hypothetical protein